MPAILVFVVFLVVLAFSVPIAIAMIAGSLAPIWITGVGGNVTQLVTNAFSGANSTPILAVPLFIFGGIIMAEGGISQKLFNFFAYFVGRFPGGVPCAVVITCLFYGAISGSGPATAAAVGSMCIPFLVSLGYERKWSSGLIVVAGGLGVIIPPSIPFVLYSLATGVSTGALFLGGIFPGILIGLVLMIYCVIHCKRQGEDRDRIDTSMQELHDMGLGRLFIDSFPALLCPIIVLGGIYAGFVTPTEAACISVFYALIVSLWVYKTIKIKDIWNIMVTAVRTYGGLAFVLAFATAFGRVLSLTGASAAITNFITSTFGGYGHRSCNHHLGSYSVACNGSFGSRPSPLWCNSGLLLGNRSCNSTIWTQPVRCLEPLWRKANGHRSQGSTFHHRVLDRFGTHRVHSLVLYVPLSGSVVTQEGI